MGNRMSLEEKIKAEQARNDGLALQIAKFKKLLPVDPAQHEPAQRMELESMEEEKRESDQRLAVLKSPEPAKLANPIVWLGSKRAWGDMILGAYNAKFIEATSELNALEQAAEHFVWKDTARPDKPLEPFKSRSVWQSLRNRDDYQDPQKPRPR